MQQALNGTTVAATTMLDGFLAVRPTPRVKRLRESYMDLVPTATIDRARIETRVMKETEGEPMITRRAKVFAAIVREIWIDIDRDELVVGYASVRPRAVNISPADGHGPGLERQLESQSGVQRNLPGFDAPDLTALSEEEKRELTEEIIPYWKGRGRYERTLGGRNYQQIPPELKNLFFADPDAYPPTPTMVASLHIGGQHYGHNILGFDRVLEKGLLGLRTEVQARLAGLDYSEPDEAAKIPFLEGVITALAAAAELGQRFSALARDKAEHERDAGRKAELLEIAEVCDRVPANPARTFHEALQSLHFAWLMSLWETPHAGGHSLGRLDQYLYPYYAEDLKEGRITEEQAQELIDCCLIKLNHGPPDAAVTVGGVKPDGNDATNALSYMFIEGMMHTRLRQPYCSVQVHHRMPDDLLIKACQLSSLGMGHPQFINNDVLVAQALARGSTGGPAVTLEDARSAAPIGCSELGIPGKDSGYLHYGGPNLAAAMELVMTNGVNRFDRKQVGLETGDPRHFRCFDDVREAFRKQVAWIRRNCQIGGSINERSVIELAPTPFESALIEGCIAEGICREEGGARYNFNTGSLASGSTDAGDSLTAIKKLVFEEKKITMEQLCHALDDNFEGHEGLRQMLLEVPKFGNDDDDADEQVAWVLHQWVYEFGQMKNLRGGHCSPGGSPMWAFVPLGWAVGALPSGRRSGEPLADAASPSAGKDANGPTAVFKSMGKVDNVEITGGVLLNMRLDPGVFRDRDGIRRFADLIRTFIDQKIYHVQVNVVSSDALRAAQKEPEKHRDLMVKVAGYNAFFTQLGRPLQDCIIARTAHGL